MSQVPSKKEEEMRKIAKKTRKLKKILKDHGQVVFLRAENYMKISTTRREMIFLDKNGKEVRVIHAFPVLRSAVPMFLKEAPQLKFKKVKPPNGWFIYSLPWQSVQAFVGIAGFLNYYTTEKPPALLKFRRSHAIRRRVVPQECYCGGACGGWWEVKAAIEYQVVLSPVPIAAIEKKG